MFMITKTTAHCSLIFFKYANRKINPNFLLHDYNLKKEVCALFVYCTEAELAPYISIPIIIIIYKMMPKFSEGGERRIERVEEATQYLCIVYVTLSHE
jgi:hypothetical protein